MTGSGMRTVTDEFKREAVRLVQTSGRTIGQVADDLGIGKSTWPTQGIGGRKTRHWSRKSLTAFSDKIAIGPGWGPLVCVG